MSLQVKGMCETPYPWSLQLDQLNQMFRCVAYLFVFLPIWANLAFKIEFCLKRVTKCTNENQTRTCVRQKRPDFNKNFLHVNKYY